MVARLVVLLSFLCCLPSVAVTQFCETVTDVAFMDRFDALVAVHESLQRVSADTGWVEIPVVFHVEMEGGWPVLTDARLDEAIEQTNRWYAPANIRFAKCGESVMFPHGTNPYQKKRSVNVGIFRQATGCAYTIGSYVFINMGCERSLENMLSHELGHVLGLPHTHGYNNTGTTDELVDGSNCSTAGDRFCDTPADPNLTGLVDASCMYVGTGLDAHGMAYHPLTNNIMSYSEAICADSLTPMQFARVRQVALASRYICCTLAQPKVTDTVVCTGATVLLHAETERGTLLWYDVPQGGTPVGVGSDFTTPPVTSSRSWYIEAEDSCTSPRACVSVRVTPSSGVITEDVHLLQDVDTVGSSAPGGLSVFGEYLLFRTTKKLWMTDGSPHGARLLLEFPDGDEQPRIAAWTSFGASCLLAIHEPGHGLSLRFVEPKQALVSEYFRVQGSTGMTPSNLRSLGAWAVFTVDDGDGGTELWRTDGTAVGTQMFFPLKECSASNSFSFTPCNGGVVFCASDSVHGEELWFSDGSAGGTQMISDIWPGPFGSNPAEFVEMNGRIYFAASDSAYGRELWETDGTIEICRRISDINPGAGPSEIDRLTVLSNLLYFSATNWSTNYEPYVSDGTSAGTRSLGEIHASRGSSPHSFTQNQGDVYSVANDGGGDELWRLHPLGSVPPRKVLDINPSGLSLITGLESWNGSLYFSANDGIHGSELWRSDGSEAGTYMVADINAVGTQGSSPDGFTSYQGKLVFTAFEANTGRELYEIFSNDIAVCSGASATLAASNQEGEVRWYESEHAADPVGVGLRWTTAPLSHSRIYWADVTVGDCSSPREAIIVRVFAPEPIVRDTSVVPGSDLELSAFATSGTLLWFADSIAGPVLTTGPLFSLHALTQDTVVYIQNTEEGCRSRRVPLSVHVGILSVDRHALPGSTELYPQPAHDKLQIRLPERSMVRSIVVYDLLGREMLRTAVTHASTQLNIDIAELPDGFYFAVLHSDHTQRTLRFIKRR